ncbi:Aste57867_4082 [Aphanomyces stellatus]|uniref:Aste57867_4082 protein n=1 Tax=Aphanomyces stellatus TaxID=120398 RepID=A0A485KC32_9STRA|nr:hypothetical protein As57867_004071 [Aphanomyces stellatus]VFT81215.1 Aste57867_4082 [Aphanomyces stellatus]
MPTPTRPQVESCGSPRPFRSKVIEELIRGNEDVHALTPIKCLEVLQALLPSPLLATLCDEMTPFIYRDVEQRVTFRELYGGLLDHVEDKKHQVARLRAAVAAKAAQNHVLAGDIAQYHATLDAHFRDFDEQACLNHIATLKHRRLLREMQCTGTVVSSDCLMKTIDDKQDRLIEQEKRIKEESHRLRAEDCTYRLNAKKFKENQALLETMAADSQCRVRHSDAAIRDMRARLAELHDAIATQTPRLAEITTEIFAVRSTRAALEAQLAAVHAQTDVIQDRVAAYKRCHTPRPDWDGVRKDVEGTFHSHNQASDTNISTTTLTRLPSTAARVEYLANAIQLIGLSQDTDAIEREKRVLHHLQLQIKKIATVLTTRRQSVAPPSTEPKATTLASAKHHASSSS